jgi:hypothetical protein
MGPQRVHLKLGRTDLAGRRPEGWGTDPGDQAELGAVGMADCQWPGRCWAGGLACCSAGRGGGLARGVADAAIRCGHDDTV